MVREKEQMELTMIGYKERIADLESQNDKHRLALNQKEESVLNLIVSLPLSPLQNDVKMNDEIKQHRDSLNNENRHLRIQLEEARAKLEAETRESASAAQLSLERIKTLL